MHKRNMCQQSHLTASEESEVKFLPSRFKIVDVAAGHFYGPDTRVTITMGSWDPPANVGGLFFFFVIYF